MNKDDDVMAKSNFFMKTIMNEVLISCIIVQTALSHILNDPLEDDFDNNTETWSMGFIYNEDKKREFRIFIHRLWTRYVPEHAITLLLFTVLFFQSTKFNNLFSRKKALIVSTWFFICLLTDIASFYQIFVEENS